MSARGCEARQMSCQKRCERCDLVWDMNDPDPPPCLTAKQIGKAALAELRSSIPAPVCWGRVDAFGCWWHDPAVGLPPYHDQLAANIRNGYLDQRGRVLP